MTRNFTLIAALLPGFHFAQNSLSVSKPEKDNTMKAELASFTVDKRLRVNLFADESMGIANPVCMRWDARGRLWVLCTWAYPQLKPGEKPNDKLLILEDTKGDGKADKISTYIDGLHIPTGFALGHGGAYIGNGRDLIHVRDTTGDGKADKREVLFTGFGTGDTHQNINSFAWSPGSGGWSGPKPAAAFKNKALLLVQLYNLESDPAEQTNLRDKHPDLVKGLVGELSQAIGNGRTNPGPKQSNEGWPSTFHPRVLARFSTLAAPEK